MGRKSCGCTGIEGWPKANFRFVGSKDKGSSKRTFICYRRGAGYWRLSFCQTKVVFPSGKALPLRQQGAEKQKQKQKPRQLGASRRKVILCWPQVLLKGRQATSTFNCIYIFFFCPCFPQHCPTTGSACQLRASTQVLLQNPRDVVCAPDSLPKSLKFQISKHTWTQMFPRGVANINWRKNNFETRTLCLGPMHWNATRWICDTDQHNRQKMCNKKKPSKQCFGNSVPHENTRGQEKRKKKKLPTKKREQDLGRLFQ